VLGGIDAEAGDAQRKQVIQKGGHDGSDGSLFLREIG
jgi:hypothetical protein